MDVAIFMAFAMLALRRATSVTSAVERVCYATDEDHQESAERAKVSARTVGRHEPRTRRAAALIEALTIESGGSHVPTVWKVLVPAKRRMLIGSTRTLCLTSRA